MREIRGENGKGVQGRGGESRKGQPGRAGPSGQVGPIAPTAVTQEGAPRGGRYWTPAKGGVTSTARTQRAWGLGGGGRAAPAQSESEGDRGERTRGCGNSWGTAWGVPSAEDGSKEAAEPGSGLVSGEASPGLAACGQSGSLSTDPGLRQESSYE